MSDAVPDGDTPWPPLGDAERAAMRELLVHGTLSRAELARRLGLSRTSLTRAARRLVDVRLVSEGATELRAWTGRPSEMLHVRPDGARFVGFKLTGDTLYAVVTDLRAEVLASVEERLDDTAVDATLDQVARVATDLTQRYPGVAAVGLCLAGDITQVRAQEVVLESHYLHWRDVPVRALLAERLSIPVTVENDVRALTAAEHWFGAGAGLTSFALVTVGVGVGTGFVVNDQLVTGTRGRAGRLEHLLVDSGGPLCDRGHRGCVSSYLTTSSIMSALRRPGLDHAGAVALAEQGDPVARRAFDDAGRALGVLIGTVINVFDPEKVVVTGDGLSLVDVAAEAVFDAVESTRTSEGGPVPIEAQPFEFTEWARAGAVLGIRALLKL